MCAGLLVNVASTGSVSARTLTSAASVKALNIAQSKSLSTLSTRLGRLETSARKAVATNPPNYDLQEAQISAAGAAVSTLFELSQAAQDSRRSSAALFERNRQLLKLMLEHNQRIIEDFQENQLDQMADPNRFFHSAAWQSPQKLISLASYWLGWNGYYASLLMQPESELRNTILVESVTGFSRAFIDFQEDEITSKSLYGRALVYKQLALYGRAAYDFKSVREKVGRDNSLYLNCLYQEAVVSQLAGKPALAESLIRSINQHYSSADIPAAIRSGMRQLETRLALNVTPAVAPKTEAGAAPSSRTLDSAILLNELRKLTQAAAVDPALLADAYAFSRTHATQLAKLDPGEIGPVGILAIADLNFEQKKLAAAEPLYRQLHRDNPPTIRTQADRVTLHLASILASGNNWAVVIELLAKFANQFPRSGLIEDAATLYYQAAVAAYQQNESGRNYQALINATQNFTRRCRQCAGVSDAYFQLGQHYIRRKESKQALKQFARVRRDSSHYFVASYYLARAQLQALESTPLAATDQANSGNWLTDKKSLDKRLQEYVTSGQQSEAVRSLTANWTLLRAGAKLLGESAKPGAAITLLSDFERQYPGEYALHAGAQALRVVAGSRLGQFHAAQTAINALSRRAANDPHHYQTLQSLGDRLYRHATAGSGHSGRTGALVYQALAENSQDPDKIPALELRQANLLQLSGQNEQALALYQRLLKRSPDMADALKGIAQTQVSLNQWQQALSSWQQLADGLEKRTPEWFSARYQTALALQQTGRDDRACTLATMIRVLNSDMTARPLQAEFTQIEATSCGSD
ncbi:MAG: tetratricopeptide repeat protein [Gammaproteobacteria bacterium]